ncbi:hypothetical protein M2368_000593 [Arthrobacter sp. JUb119]|nr:hypothetical protein [Arthrobacter sp. JUb119]
MAEAFSAIESDDGAPQDPVGRKVNGLWINL